MAYIIVEKLIKMKKILILLIMATFFGIEKSNAQENKKSLSEKNESTEENKGIIGRYYENNFPVILKFVNELPDREIISKFHYLTVVSWKYDGSKNNGMPLAEVNKRMIVLEDAIEESIISTGVFTHAYSRTGNNLKEFVYYSTSQNEFMKVLNRTLEKHEVYPIEINFYEDKEWTEFKKLLEDFKK